MTIVGNERSAGNLKLSGWGRYPALDCRVERLHGWRDLPGLIERGGSLIARGNGRSYGDAALNPDLTLSMLAMNRMLAFDTETGLLTCEAGVLLADILTTFVPRGWFPPVVPGTKFVTVGGMIAADVHGKNHHRDGTFGAHVQSLTLATADGEMRECSRTENANLFRATIGGMGLTGVILAASFRLRPIETAFVTEETLATRNLDEAMALFEESGDWPYSVAWIDCLARGAKLGRALLTRGAFTDRSALPPRLVPHALRPAPAGRFRVPLDAPSSLLNPFSISSFNALYYRRGQARAGTLGRRARGDHKQSERHVHFDSFFFPLDRIEAWNRLYGRRGFVQYQCLLPKKESAVGMAALLERVATAGQGSFLAVLKLFGPAGDGLMSFPMEGFTLALDFPLRDGTLALLDELDEITNHHGGRVYLAKDACCAPERVRDGYPGFAAFQAMRAEAAGEAHGFASELSRRLAL